MQNRAGTYKENLSGKTAYRSFSPAPLPPEPKIETDGEMLIALASAKARAFDIEPYVKKRSKRQFVCRDVRQKGGFDVLSN